MRVLAERRSGGVGARRPGGAGWAAWLLALAVACAAGPAPAQPGPAPPGGPPPGPPPAGAAAPPAMELDRSEALLRRAGRAVEESGDEAARLYLEQARRFQSRAVNAYEAGLPGQAVRLTRLARRRAQAALAAALPASVPASVAAALRRAGALLDRIEPAVRECGGPAAEADFAAARQAEDDARSALLAQRPEAAAGHLARARALAFGALAAADSACGGEPGRARRAVGRTGDLLAESEWLAAAGGPAAEGYRRAREHHRDAVVAVESGRYQRALRQAGRAREALVRALESADPPLAHGAVDAAVRRSRERLVAAERAAAGDRRLLAEARDRQRRAESLLRQGRLPAALAETSAVGSLLDRLGI